MDTTTLIAPHGINVVVRTSNVEKYLSKGYRLKEEKTEKEVKPMEFLSSSNNKKELGLIGAGMIFLLWLFKG